MYFHVGLREFQLGRRRRLVGLFFLIDIKMRNKRLNSSSNSNPNGQENSVNNQKIFSNVTSPFFHCPSRSEVTALPGELLSKGPHRSVVALLKKKKSQPKVLPD